MSWQLVDALWASDKVGISRFDSAQYRHHSLFRMIEEEWVPLSLKHGFGIIVAHPDGWGHAHWQIYRQRRPAARDSVHSAGRGSDVPEAVYWNDAVFGAVEELQRFFTTPGKSLTQVAMAWVLGRPGVTFAL